VLVAIKLLTAKLHSLYVKGSESEILEKGEHFTFDSATLFAKTLLKQTFALVAATFLEIHLKRIK